MISSHSLREQLREATQDTHQRLHLHPGFAAIQNGTIDKAEYKALLTRLLGFYQPLEANSGVKPIRSQWLVEDILAMHHKGDELLAVAQCRNIPPLDTPQRRLGSLYVIEGSSLGGRTLAKNLDYLFGGEPSAGRRFFQGHGAATGDNWNRILFSIAAEPDDADARDMIVTSAVKTFIAFENWLNDYGVSSND